MSASNITESETTGAVIPGVSGFLQMFGGPAFGPQQGPGIGGFYSVPLEGGLTLLVLRGGKTLRVNLMERQSAAGGATSGRVRAGIQ